MRLWEYMDLHHVNDGSIIQGESPAYGSTAGLVDTLLDSSADYSLQPYLCIVAGPRVNAPVAASNVLWLCPLR